LNEIDFKDFHNHPGKVQDREKMLDGQWPGNGCEYCKRIEDAGGNSERTAYINDADYCPPELEDNPFATKVTPRILEVYFTNLCNQACVYCSPLFSSVIEQEIKKYGPLETEYDLEGSFKPKENYSELKDKFWEWMEEHSTELYDFQILGGEPLYQPEFEECLEYFERTSHPNLNWKIFSNLKHPSDKFVEKIQKIDRLVESGKLKSFGIVCSMDCWGDEAEFARHGMSLENWEQNFNTLLKTKNVQINIQATLSSVTLPTAYVFVDKLVEWSKIKNINYGANVVAVPSFMDPAIFGSELKPFIDKLNDSLAKSPWKDAAAYIAGFGNMIISTEPDPEKLTRLRNYLNRLDQRRGQSWRRVYPWMENSFDKFI
jgi:organic radical activating enzyme